MSLIANGVPYEPRPGTLPYRAIAWLEEHAAGFEATASQIAEALNADPTGIVSCLASAVDHGALARRTPAGQSRPWYYSLPANPKGPAGAAHRPTTAKETADGRKDRAGIAATRETAIRAGDDAKCDGGPAGPGGLRAAGAPSGDVGEPYRGLRTPDRVHQLVRVERSVTFHGLTAHEAERIEQFVRRMRGGVA